MREKIFFAMPRNETVVPDLSRCQMLVEGSSGKTADLCLSSDVFQETFEGDWNDWIDNTVNGVDYYTRRFKYGVIVCMTELIGKATARIVEGALVQQKPVFLFRGQDLEEITGVETIDRENWQEGWKLLRRSSHGK